MKSTGEKVDVCQEQGNGHRSEILWKASLPNQDHSVTQNSKESLLPQQPLASQTHPPVPALPPASPALDNLSAHTTLHLDLSSQSPPTALNALKSQVEPMNPLCRQAVVNPTEMKSVGNQISHVEEKLTPRMSHSLSSDLVKAGVEDDSLESPGKNVENAQSMAHCNIESAISMLTEDGPNPLGIMCFK